MTYKYLNYIDIGPLVESQPGYIEITKNGSINLTKQKETCNKKRLFRKKKKR